MPTLDWEDFIFIFAVSKKKKKTEEVHSGDYRERQ